MKKIALVLMIASVAQACASKPPAPLKSPCVGIQGSPCARTPINGNHIQSVEEISIAS